MEIKNIDDCEYILNFMDENLFSVEPQIKGIALEFIRAGLFMIASDTSIKNNLDRIASDFKLMNNKKFTSSEGMSYISKIQEMQSKAMANYEKHIEK